MFLLEVRMKNISKEEKLKILDTALDSKEFSKSPTSSNLLRFLVKSTLDGKKIKETTIGIELFGNQFLEENNSSRIRVNIYNLRKKLDHYYKNEGAHNVWRIVIDKGQYYTSFANNTTFSREVNYKRRYSLALLVSLGMTIALAILLYAFSYKTKVPFWNSFFENDKKTTVIIGDVFGFMAETKTGRMGWNRDYQINTVDEFYAFQKKHPDFTENVFPASYSYLTKMGPIATYNLTKIFNEQHKDFSIRFSTKLGYEEIKEHNSVYVGPTKNDNKFIQYFNEKKSHFKITDRRLYYKNPDKNKDEFFDLNISGTAYEYAIVSRLKGIEGTEQFLFFSDHDIGVIAAIEMFCNEDKSKQFKEEYGLNSDTFTALFKIKGKERTNLDLEILVVEEVTPK